MSAQSFDSLDGTVATTEMTIVVAMDEQRGIGHEGDLPWKLSNDLKRFRRITTPHTLIMGRKTYESIGRPLPDRETIVLTRQPDFRPDGVQVVSSVAATLAAKVHSDQAFIVGGGEIYQLFLPLAKKLHITHVHTTVPADTWFPELDSEWTVESEQPFPADEKNNYATTYRIYSRASSDAR